MNTVLPLTVTGRAMPTFLSGSSATLLPVKLIVSPLFRPVMAQVAGFSKMLGVAS